MVKYFPFLLLLLILLLASDSIAQQSYTGQTIQEILELPENEIDLGLAVLVLAKEVYPNMNVDRFIEILDFQASRIDLLLQGIEDPEVRIGMMNSYLYKADWWNDSLSYSYDIQDLEANNKENQFLNGLISTRKGSCITMPMHWLVLADRLGWPVYAVQSTNHYFLRYEDDRLSEKNIDATAWGGFLPDEQYKIDGQIPDRAIDNGVFLRSLTKREYLGTLLVNQARHYVERENNLGKAIEYLELSISIVPTNSPSWWNAGVHYYHLAQKIDEEWETRLRNAYDSATAELISSSYQRNHPQTLPNPHTSANNNLLQARTPAFNIPQPAHFQQRNAVSQTNPPVHSAGHSQVEVHIDQQLREDLHEQLQILASSLESEYKPKIEYYVQKSKDYRAKAQELGISFGFTEEFIIKQQQSIELQFLNEN